MWKLIFVLQFRGSERKRATILLLFSANTIQCAGVKGQSNGTNVTNTYIVQGVQGKVAVKL